MQRSLNRLKQMAQNIAIKVLRNAEEIEKKLADLRYKFEEVKKIKVEEKIKQLAAENKILTAKISQTREELIRLETLNGKKQYSIPGKQDSVIDSVTLTEPLKTDKEQKPIVKKEKKKVEPQHNSSVAATISDVPDVRKLDFRIGKIVEVNRHPDADTLYVEKIDCGEDKPRTVVSGLVNHVPIEEMKDRIVMVLCNLKPMKMRGITSEAMVMCASSPEKVEVLIPPSNAIPGDLVFCTNYPREPEPILNPKKKVFESCAPDLKTNEDKVACYKGSPLLVEGKGPVVAATLKGVSVK